MRAKIMSNMAKVLTQDTTVTLNMFTAFTHPWSADDFS